MPNDQQGFSLQELKTNPKMWMRLAMPSKNGKYLENVFKDKENPFEKNNQAAVETIQKLAAEGKLYLRDFGRSRHFQKVEKDGDKLKLGNQQEIKFSNNTAGLGLAVLMWMSRGYFKWIGLERISNWFDGRLKRRSEIIELNNRYKEEYKELSKEEKKRLKALRKHEKNLKKLEKIQKEAEKTQRELDKLSGVDTANTKGEMDSPLSQPPTVEQKENTMQPTLTGDQLVHENKPIQQKQENNLVQTQAVREEIIGTKKDVPQQNEKKSQLFIGGVELTDETAKQFPPHIVEAFKILQQLIVEQEANKMANQQPIQEQPALQTQQNVNEIKQEVPAVAEETQVTEENRIEEAPQQQMNAPLREGADLEPEQVNVQERPKDQAQMNLQERLAAEKQDMEAVKDWKNFIENSLFSHEEASVAKDYYDMLNKGNEAAGAEFLSGAVFGILTSKSAGPEQKQQVMDALLSGKPLGSEHQNLIDNGIAAYNDAIARKTGGNSDRLADMVANTIRELSHQASRETTLSPRLVMLGKLLSNTAKMANEYGLELPLDEEELIYARGAATLAEVSEKYYEARQQLGNDFSNIGGQEKRGAVRDLLMGNAVEKMIQQNIESEQSITNTQQIMGKGLWTLKNLRIYTSASATRRGIQPENIQTLLEKPNSTKALGIGVSTVNEIVQATQKRYNSVENAVQREMELAQQENQPEINPLGVPG